MEILKHRPRELRWYHAAGLLYGDWGTSRLYVLGLAFVMSGASSFYFILAMCALTSLVGFSYTIICRHFPDGGGVYSAARRRSQILGVIGGLLLFADYIVTAALSAYEGFRYILPSGTGSRPAMYLAVVSILLIGALNFFGPRRAGLAALAAAVFSFVFYAAIGGFCLAKAGPVELELPVRAAGESWFSFANVQWEHFVNVILALSGVEAIANMTGVMAEPVARNARLAILLVLVEVVAFNLIMAWAMNGLPGLAGQDAALLSAGEQEDLRDHMVKILAATYVGPTFASVSSIFFGLLLLSAANTAIGDMVSIQYLMSRDRELPPAFAVLNRFGMPRLPLLMATFAPAAILLVVGNNFATLADLYAIGVVGAITINLLACGNNYKLDLRRWERGTLLAVGVLTAGIEVTIALDKPLALLFAGLVLGSGLLARRAAAYARERLALPWPAPVPPPASLPALPLNVPRLLVPTRGNPKLFRFAAQYAANRKAIVFVLFVREVALSFRERGASLATHDLTRDRDAEAQEIFKQAGAIFDASGITMVPLYVVHDSPAEVILDYGATLGVDAVMMGASRRNPFWLRLRGDVLKEVIQHLPGAIPLIIHA